MCRFEALFMVTVRLFIAWVSVFWLVICVSKLVFWLVICVLVKLGGGCID